PRLERAFVGVADDERDGNLTQARVGRADDGGVSHTRSGAQHLLHLARHDLVAATVDDFTDAALDPDEPVLVDAGEVTGPQVPVGVEPVAEALAAEVARRHPWGPHRELALSDQLDLHTGMRPAHGADLLGVGAGVGGGPPDHLADLGLPVSVEHADPETIREPAAAPPRPRAPAPAP